MPLSPSMGLAERADHRYRVIEGKLPAGEVTSVPGAVKAVDDGASRVADQWRFTTVDCGSDGCRKLELMNLAKNEVFTVVAGTQIPGSFVSRIVIVKP